MPGKSLAFMVDGIAYNILSETTCEVTSHNTIISNLEYKGNIVIPENVTYNGRSYIVTEIDTKAFSNCLKLTSVEIPNTVTKIGGGAFMGCNNMENVALGNSVEEILGMAFISCWNLKSITIPNTVTYIGERAFFDCAGLTRITIPDAVTTIGQYAFARCHDLASVTIGISVTKIDNYTFQDCEALTSIVIPNTAQMIGYYAFDGCSSLKNVTIGNSVMNICGYAFQNCSSLESVIIPNSVITIENYAFSGCLKLTNATIGNSVIDIGKGAFCYCGLLSIIIPNSIHMIRERTFQGCDNLENVIMGNTVTSIGQGAFEDCLDLTKITIPSTVTKIGMDAFSMSVVGPCALKTLVIEDGYKDLWNDYRTFNKCPIENLYLGRNLTYDVDASLETRPFTTLTTLIEITIGNSVKDVTSINWTKNEGLKNIRLLTSIPPTSNTFTEEQYENVKVTIPAGSLSAYQADEVWKNFWNIQEDEATGINNVEACDGECIKVENGNIVVDNAKGRVSVYDAAGTLVKNVKADGNRIDIAVPSRGVYIVRAGGKSVKVAM